MIKKFAETDYSEIINLWMRSVEATHEFLAQEDFDFYKSVVPQYFSHVKQLYIFEEEDILKGFLGVSEEEIDMLFVDPSFFGEGVGKQLLNFAITELGLKKVDVNEQNIKAFEFYHHFGFRVVDRSTTDGMGKPYPILHLQLV